MLRKIMVRIFWYILFAYAERLIEENFTEEFQQLAEEYSGKN